MLFWFFGIEFVWCIGFWCIDWLGYGGDGVVGGEVVVWFCFVVD